jgi:hypothetical protein
LLASALHWQQKVFSSQYGPVSYHRGGKYPKGDLSMATTSMKQRPQRSEPGSKALRAQKVVKQRARSVKSAKQGRQGSELEKTLSLIRKHPGIRPSELNRFLNREQSDGLRNTLIKRGLIRKEKDGLAMRYYPL